MMLCNLSILSSSPEAAKFLVPGDGLSHTQVPESGDMDFTEFQGRLLQLSGIIDMENIVSIGCAGAIIIYLQGKRSSTYLQQDPSANQPLGIAAIETLSLKGTMCVVSTPLLPFVSNIHGNIGLSTKIRLHPFELYSQSLTQTPSIKAQERLRRVQKKVFLYTGFSITLHVHLRERAFSGSILSVLVVI